MIDWEDVWDTAKTIIGLVLVLAILIAITLLFSNNAQTNVLSSVDQVINGTQYSCSAAITSNFEWDFTFHKDYWVTYIIVFPVMSIIALLMLGIIFGYIPICGCGIK